MSKTILRSLLFALAGVFASDLRAAPAWTTTDVAPASWTALANNLLAGETGTINGTIASGYSTNDPNLLTDGQVQTTGGNAYRVGFQGGSSIEWTFVTPKTIEQVRVSACYYDGSTYTELTIGTVSVKLAGSDTWDALAGSDIRDVDGRSQNVVICASLSDSDAGHLAQHVVGLKIAFVTPKHLASYCVEIEAAGSAEATGPVVDSFDVAPAKTKATVSGSIADPGTDATACDVYLALGGGAATKIAAGASGSFEYRITGLTAGTSYAYELSVSNNAPTAKGTVRTGTFTTLAADAQTASWTQEDVAPGDWLALTDNILAGKHGTLTSGAIAGTNYATNDSSVLTDGTVPTTGGAAYIYGFQNNATMEWSLDKAMTLERLRISACYLAGSTYTKLAVSSVSVKLAGSDTWTALDAPAFSDIAGKSQNVILLATLSDCETGVLSENVVGLRIVFGNVNALGSYCAEIEAVGHAEGKTGKMVIFVH